MSSADSKEQRQQQYAASKATSSSTSSGYGASHSSFYTTEEKKDKYETLDDILNEKCSDLKIRQVIKDLLKVCADITIALRTALVTVEGSTNDFGDCQLSVDVSLNKRSELSDMLLSKGNITNSHVFGPNFLHVFAGNC